MDKSKMKRTLSAALSILLPMGLCAAAILARAGTYPGRYPIKMDGGGTPSIYINNEFVRERYELENPYIDDLMMGSTSLFAYLRVEDEELTKEITEFCRGIEYDRKEEFWTLAGGARMTLVIFDGMDWYQILHNSGEPEFILFGSALPLQPVNNRGGMTMIGRADEQDFERLLQSIEDYCMRSRRYTARRILTRMLTDFPEVQENYYKHLMSPVVIEK